MAVHQTARPDLAPQWYVLHTKPRQEKALAADLAALGVEHYLPLLSKIRYYGRRKAKVRMPLFPGYTFLRGTIDQTYLAERTRRVAGVIHVVDQDLLEWEIGTIRQALMRSAELSPFPFPFFEKGVRVEVRAGPFRGLQGYVLESRPNGRLILRVRALGGAASLEIDESLLDRIDDCDPMSDPTRSVGSSISA